MVKSKRIERNACITPFRFFFLHNKKLTFLGAKFSRLAVYVFNWLFTKNLLITGNIIGPVMKRKFILVCTASTGSDQLAYPYTLFSLHCMHKAFAGLALHQESKEWKIKYQVWTDVVLRCGRNESTTNCHLVLMNQKSHL